MHQNGTDQRRGSAAQSAERRNAVRHAHAERVTLTTQWGVLSGSLMNLSTSGAQMRLTNGLVPVEGDEVMLRLVDGCHLAGSIAWVDRQAIGIAFERALPSVEDVLWLEQRGPDWFYANVRAYQ